MSADHNKSSLSYRFAGGVNGGAPGSFFNPSQNTQAATVARSQSSRGAVGQVRSCERRKAAQRYDTVLLQWVLRQGVTGEVTFQLEKSVNEFKKLM